MDFAPLVEEQRDYVVALRRHFHSRPERSLEEFETAAKIEAELDAAGIEHRRVGETGVAASIRGKAPGKGRTAALRADIDALPIQDAKTVPYRSGKAGVMHACGHDAHAAALLGAARVLSALSPGFSGEVRLFFQQAEEVGQGAKQFIRAGLLEGVDRVFGIHVSSAIPAGKVAVTSGATNASCDYFKIVVSGKSGHVSRPHLAVDALHAAAQIVVALQAIVARRTDPLDSVVVGVGVLKAGTNYNIVANEAVIEGTTRTFSREARERTNRWVAETAAAIAALSGASAETAFVDYACPLVNDAAVCRLVQPLAAALVGPENVVLDNPKSLGADDFAEFLQLVPGAYVQVGTADPALPDTLSGHHHERFDIAESALRTAVGLHVAFALEVLEAGS